MNLPEALDPVSIEIVRNALISAAVEMGIVLKRTAYNYIINEGQDFSVGLFNELGETLAQAPGLPEFVCDIPSAIHSIIDDIGGVERFAEGDIYLTNDPYANTFHVHDVNAIKPIFLAGELIGFSCVRAHWHDLGGASGAGSLQATEVFQEGIILRSVRLYNAGELNVDILRIVRENTRLPDGVLGDIRAQVGACRIGELRYLEIVERFGNSRFRSATQQILDIGEQQAREALLRIPPGVYEAETCLDNDGLDLDRPLPVKALVKVDADRISIDVSGSAAWCRGPMHANKNTTTSICRMVFKMLTTPTEPANEGHFRMVTVKIPEESIFNAKRPQGTWPGFFALEALIDVIKRALAEAIPDRVNADDYGKCTPAHIKGNYPDGSIFFLADTEGGGWGGKPYEDGENAMLFGDVRITPVELLESKYPVRLSAVSLKTGFGRARVLAWRLGRNQGLSLPRFRHEFQCRPGSSGLPARGCAGWRERARESYCRQGCRWRRKTTPVQSYRLSSRFGRDHQLTDSGRRRLWEPLAARSGTGNARCAAGIDLAAPSQISLWRGNRRREQFGSIGRDQETSRIAGRKPADRLAASISGMQLKPLGGSEKGCRAHAKYHTLSLREQGSL